MSVDVITFGCRLNTFESEIIRRRAEDAGVDDAVDLQHLRRHQRGRRAGAAIDPQAEARAARRAHRRHRLRGADASRACSPAMDEVDRVLGNDDKLRARCVGRDARGVRLCQTPDAKIAVSDIMAVKAMAPHLVDGFQRGLPRAFVQVQNGCDHRCTFCIIPYGRGNSRSVAMDAVIDQVRALTEAGHAEIVLTGVDLTSYGGDLPGAPKLGALVKQILKAVPELQAAAAVVDRFDRGRSRSARRHRERRAADAASASVAAGGRRSRPEAHEAPAFARAMRLRSASRCAACGRTSRSAPTSSPASRPRPTRCSPARSIWSTNAG